MGGAAELAAEAIEGTFHRIQFTPDLLPGDITGTDIFRPEDGSFVFQPGPIFANVVLADEVNRATPKTQSALLEAMQEAAVTVGGESHPLPSPFLMLATQNPIEMEGTYPLPAAQIDRFLMKLSIGYPSVEEEINIVEGNPSASVLPKMKSVVTKKEILSLCEMAERVHCDRRLTQCAVRIADKSRHAPGITLGVSPRGSIMLINACKAYALVKGRDYVTDSDISVLAPLVYSHRIQTKSGKFDAIKIITDLTAAEVDKIER